MSAVRGSPRILTVVPICDGHDSPILTINLELARHGIEVIYLGYHRSVRDIARAAIQEDAQAIGISSYNGGHIEFFSELLRLLRKSGAGHIRVFGGGGGTITEADARVLKERGVDEIFFAGTPLDDIVGFVRSRYHSQHPSISQLKFLGKLTDLKLSKLLTAAAAGPVPSTLDPRPSTLHPLPIAAPERSDGGSPLTIGITGPGGAGKTTLIDELTSRFLKARPKGRLAVLSHDPSLVGKGALLGDRATMVYAQDDRVFMRSLGTRGRGGWVSAVTGRCVRILKRAGFDLILIESVGIGQEDMPFGRGLVDHQVLVMSPEYGGRLQLQKIAMLDEAGIVVVNKTDLPAAKTAMSELEQRLVLNRRLPPLIATTAKRHSDPGTDQLFTLIMSNRD